MEAGDWGVLGGIGLVEFGASLALGITICSSCCRLLPAPPPGPVEGDEPGGLENMKKYEIDEFQISIFQLVCTIFDTLCVYGRIPNYFY